jgi:hypothetical protein
MSRKRLCNDTDRITEVLWEEPVLVPFERYLGDNLEQDDNGRYRKK